MSVEVRDWLAGGYDFNPSGGGELRGERVGEAEKWVWDFEEDARGAKGEDEREIAEEVEGVAEALFGVEKKCGVGDGLGGLVAPEGLGEGAGGIFVVGAQPAGFVFAPASGEVAAFEELQGKIPVAFGVGGTEVDGATEDALGVGSVDEGEDFAEAAGGVGVVGLKAQGFAESGDGGGVFEAVAKGDAEVAVGFDEVGVDAEGVVEVVDGGGGVAFVDEDGGEVAVGVGEVWREAKGAEIELDGGGGLGGFLDADAGGVPDFGEVGIEGEDAEEDVEGWAGVAEIVEEGGEGCEDGDVRGGGVGGAGEELAGAGVVSGEVGAEA
jgi:hypothetical protein